MSDKTKPVIDNILDDFFEDTLDVTIVRADNSICLMTHERERLKTIYKQRLIDYFVARVEGD